VTELTRLILDRKSEYMAGRAIKDIARDIGCSTSTVKNTFYAYGITKKQKANFK